MDGHSEHPGDPAGEDGDVAAEPPEPRPRPQPGPGPLDASAGGVAEDEPAEPAEPREGPAAAELGGEAEPGEPERPAEPEPEPEPGGPAEARPEEMAQSGPEGGPAEPEEPAESEADEGDGEGDDEEGRQWEEAASAPEAAREGEEPGEEEEEEGEEAESEGLEGRGAAQLRERAASADDDDGGGEWTEEVQRRQEQQLRAELLRQYRALVGERGRSQRYNSYLQHKISEALRKKKGPEAAEGADKGTQPDAPGKEQAYLRHLAALEELRKQQADDLDWYRQELAQLKQAGREHLSRVEKEWRAFQALKKQVVVQAMGSCRARGGRQAALREVEQIQELEEKKEKEMSAVRLENVQLKQSLVHFETRMRAQEDMTEGLLLIDFEQLKIENQTFNEKVEERNEELVKLRSKLTNNVQVITHVKEKLHFVDMENACKKSQLLEIEAQVALRRDILTKTKQARDRLRTDNIKLNQKCGLVGKEPLLRDLEEKVDRTVRLQQHLESLKRHHAGLTMSCKGVRQKIREAKAFLPP
ncbi:coiled-coil domain-containing protein 96 [Hyaena hyaena]|uniref:coiled-coil domain-containing protein 96 n=1 Tax=Hyaena hyaena TaxID=95912 RepID=UPI001920437B|nr:coiled-coil domain-containing protein 96 [Hyaena hyaena]